MTPSSCHRGAAVALPRTIRSLLSAPPSTVTAASPDVTVVHGWVKTIRHHKNVSFVEISDGTSAESLQAVIKKNKRDGMHPAVDGLHLGSSVTLHGTLQPSKGTSQSVELSVQDIRVTGTCDPEVYPIQNKPTPSSVLRDAHAHLRFRTSLIGSLMRFRDGLMRNWADWFEANDFVHIHTPVITSSDCEGAGEAFRVTTDDTLTHPSSTSTTDPSKTLPPQPFFPTPVYLTVSSQLHLEAPTHSLARTYTLSPTFRAEPSATSRHLAEFYMLEAEVAFVDTLPELLSTVEQGIKAAVAPLVVDEASNVSGSGLVDRGARNRSDLVTIRRNLRDEAGEVLDKSFAGLDITRDFLDRPFGQMSYTDAIEVLQQRHQSHPFVHPPIWGAGLQSEHEKYLAGSVERGPLFVHDYPVALKPFYMRLNDQMAALPPSMARNTDDHSTVACFDLLVPDIGELVGGSLREERFDNLERAIDRHGLDKQAYDWYLDLRRFGSVKHGGWGMGWERFVCWVTGVGNVRDVVAFPRWKGHCRY